MNNVFVYCELEGTIVADVSLELLTKGRKLANELGCQLEAIVAGSGLEASIALRRGQGARVRRTGIVPLHHPAPRLHPD